jgi:polyisoprenoid-binding protein YceI
VKSSVDIEGHFEKWDATLTFTSPKISTGVLDIKIQAATVNTGSGMKDDKLKSKDLAPRSWSPQAKPQAPAVAASLSFLTIAIG